MIARDLISKVVPPLRPGDDADRALLWMDDFKVSHLPVVDGKKFLGLLSEADIMDANAPGSTIAELDADLEKAFVKDIQHIYAVIRRLASTDLTCIAVLDHEDNYVGCITLSDLVVKFDELAVISRPGGILAIHMKESDYSLAQLAHIIESNGTSILSSYIAQQKGVGMIDVTMKVDREDLGPTIQSLERHGYQVTAYLEEGSHNEDLRGRYDELMRYINI
ncbi:MAG: CBS domain-containing protein [Flavobacteriales bacterium]|nr:CBS domain-containing protein [Flavobacteriales bacterium]